MTLVKVTWRDAYVSTEQHTLDSIPGVPLVVETYGLLLRDDDSGVAVASEHIPGEAAFRAVSFIPRGMIVEVQPLTPPAVPRTTRRRSRVPTPPAG
jgi:hypothetical protein